MRNIGLGLLWAIPYGIAESLCDTLRERLPQLGLVAVSLQSMKEKCKFSLSLAPHPPLNRHPRHQHTQHQNKHVTPTGERIYIPVYQNPIAPKKVTTSPTLPTEIQTNPKAEVKRSPATKPKQPENRTPVTSGSAIPEQEGNCKELHARGIENIDVKANPWASKLDRDKDGVACEAN
jgi:hypothetical protein